MKNNSTYQTLHVPEILNAIRTLTHSGHLKEKGNRFIYLDIDDDFIHLTYPILQAHMHWIQKPDYFYTNGIGAHISVIYPEENIVWKPDPPDQKHYFNITGLFTTALSNKQYYMLGVSCEALRELRNTLGLPDKLYFKTQYVDLHITIGVSPIFTE